MKLSDYILLLAIVILLPIAMLILGSICALRVVVDPVPED